MLKLEFLPEATRKNFERLKNDPRLTGFSLVGGTALALQIGHRISEDLDFNIFGQPLPKKKIDALLSELLEAGAAIESLVPAEKKVAHRINTGHDLDDLIQDYLMDGARVTFHSRNAQDRPKGQIEFLKSAQKLKVANEGFDVLGLPGLFVMKSLVVYDRVKSRDLYDLMVLTREHGYTLKDVLKAIDAYQPVRHKDPEYFKSVVTGIVPVDKDDEGFSSIRLNVKMSDVYKYFRASVRDYEIDVAKALTASIKSKPH